MDLRLARISLLALAAALFGALGCTPVNPVGGGNPAGGSEWISLFDGSGMGRWSVVRGSVTCRDGVMVLDGRGKDASILARGISLKNGTVEVEVWRKGPGANAGPYTVALRLPFRLGWQSIYFVCRPDNVEASRATASRPHPLPERKTTFEKTDRPELWRFVMNDRKVDCYRLGEKVLSYIDTDPCRGTIGLTASRCRVEVLGIRYRSAGGQ